MGTDPDPEEAARRLRAALAYVGMGQEEAARALGVSVPTLARMTGRKGSDGIRPADWGDLWKAADALGLPRAWFVADFSQLYQLVPDDMPDFRNESRRKFAALKPTGAERAAAQARTEQELQKEALRSSLRPPAERDTKRSQRRRRSATD